MLDLLTVVGAYNALGVHTQRLLVFVQVRVEVVPQVVLDVYLVLGSYVSSSRQDRGTVFWVAPISLGPPLLAILNAYVRDVRRRTGPHRANPMSG